MENSININKTFSAVLPADFVKENYIRQVKGACFSFVDPQFFPSSQLVHFSDSLLKYLGLTLSKNELLKLGNGQQKWDSFKSYAMRYGGHQFGHWAGQLGDGRAINIAEINLAGKNWKFQLKGAGPTPYSRQADGYAVLRSSIREYLCSEAMYHLGVPTTRALTLVLSGENVMRDMLYNGNPEYEKGAIVCRVSPSFIRFGNYQIHSASQEIEILRQLVDYTIKEHYPHLGKPNKETYLAFFNEVCERTIDMIVHWQRVGFIHGVMNTDNMSILGLTIDYGPYGWVENYDPHWTPNTTDAQSKRYRFGNQSQIGMWNLVQLANALFPLIQEVEPLEKILDYNYQSFFEKYHTMMLSKLGLTDNTIPTSFIEDLTNLLEKREIDMTIFFRKLSTENIMEVSSFNEILKESTYKEEYDNLIKDFTPWYIQYANYLQKQPISLEDAQLKMKKVNPKYVLRNYMAQLAIDDAEQGNYKVLDELYQVLLNPYEEQPNMEKWFAKRPDWAKHKIGCSMLSCSS